jgi:hypothetical protein
MRYLRRGYAAGCAARLCRAGATKKLLGLRPRFGLSPHEGRSPSSFSNLLRRGVAPPHIRRRSRSENCAACLNLVAQNGFREDAEVHGDFRGAGSARRPMMRQQS